MAEPELPRVSVVVPVWNDATRLRKCLSALQALNYSRDRLEVIVVDNGSTDESATVAQSFAQMTLLNEKRPGSYCARNLGLAHATGDYVAFIDSDCEAEPNWLIESIKVAQETPRIGVVAGCVQISPPPKGPTWASRFEQIFAFNQEQNARNGTCVTANWVSPKALLVQFGGFEDRLKSGADMRLARRLSQNGHPIRYAASAIVRHPARSTVAALIGKRQRTVGGRWTAELGAGALGMVRMLRYVTGSFVAEFRVLLRRRDCAYSARLQALAVSFMLWIGALGELARLSFGGQSRRA